MSRRYVACLGGIDFTGGFKNRATADRDLVLLDRTAREQIDLATEDVLDLLVKLKKIPPEMDFGPECDQQVDIAAAMRVAAREGAEHFQPGNAMTLAKGREAGLDLVQRRRKSVVRRNHKELSISNIAQDAGFAELK